MSRGSNQKLKLHILAKIMLTKTDENHSLTMPQIIKELKKYGVSAERKSIYTDFRDMKESLGIEVVKEKTGRDTVYKIVDRDFELAEVKLLIEAVQSSKFITQHKSRKLIGKIKGLVSEYQAKQLQRHVYVNDRIKTMNDSVYYSVDDIHTAIYEGKKIKFMYCEWSLEKKLIPVSDGAWEVVSPWAVVWYNENCYVVAYDGTRETGKRIKHYRVDKMTKITICDEPREGLEVFKNFDVAAHSRMNFGMLGGEKKKVSIQFPNRVCGILIDRFGKEIVFHPVDETHSEVTVDVVVSPQFYGWIFSLGGEVRITGPEGLKKEIHEIAEKITTEYQDVMGGHKECR